MARAMAPAPPRSFVPESASASSMSISLGAPDIVEEEIEFASVFETDASSRRSDALNSKISHPNSEAIACASAVFPVPVGPHTKRGGRRSPLTHASAHSLAAAVADGLPMISEVRRGFSPESSMSRFCRGSLNTFNTTSHHAYRRCRSTEQGEEHLLFRSHARGCGNRQLPIHHREPEPRNDVRALAVPPRQAWPAGLQSEKQPLRFRHPARAGRDYRRPGACP